MSSDEKALEYRICWNASSNISFHGHTDWSPWEDEDATEADIHHAMEMPPADLPRGQAEALEACGFESWVETRPATHTLRFDPRREVTQ